MTYPYNSPSGPDQPSYGLGHSPTPPQSGPEQSPTLPPYGYGRPPSPPPPTAGPPPVSDLPPNPPKKRRGLLIGVVAMVLVLAGVAGTLVATGVVDFGEKPTIEKTKEKKDRTYGFVDDLCTRAKLDGIEEAIAPLSGELENEFTAYDGFGGQVCSGKLYNSVTQTFGSVRVDLAIFEDARTAKDLFDMEGNLVGYDLKEFDGDWVKGGIGRTQNPEGSNFGAIILDGNMQLSIQAGIAEFEPEEKDAFSAITETVKRVQEVARGSDELKEPPAKTEESGAAEGDYVFTDDLCEKIDWSMLDAFPFESLDGGEYEPDANIAGAGIARCHNGSFDDDDLKKNAAMQFSVETSKNAKAASGRYQELLNDMERGSESIRDIDGDWEQGKLGSGGTAIRIEGVVVVLIDNLVVRVALNYWGEEGTQKDAEKALVDLAGQALELSRK